MMDRDAVNDDFPLQELEEEGMNDEGFEGEAG